MKERVIIGPHAGGVGDNLLYGWIPELVKARNPEAEILIGVNGLNPKWRNSESYDLIWGCNPHVAGFTDETPNAGVHMIVNDFIGEAKRHGSAIAAVEYLHGFEPVHRLPKLYYEPKFRPEFADRVLISPTSISCPTPNEAIDEFAFEIARWHQFNVHDIIVMRSEHDGQYGRLALQANEHLDVKDIYEWVDLIYSCKLFLTSESGGSAVAAALRKPGTTHALCSLWTFNDKLWLYDNITYRVSKRINLPGDYHPYPPTNRPPNVWGEVAV